MSEYLRILASFVPRLVAERIDTNAVRASVPTERRVEAAVLFADVSGFTALTETLARRGGLGAEELTRILNGYFGALIDTVAAHGGDIVKFAGDALIALWPAEGAEGLADAARRVAACALVLQKELHAFEAAPDRKLLIKLAVGAGPVLLQQVGGVFDRWEPMVSGAALGQVGIANDHARPGDVIVSAEARALLGEAAAGEDCPDSCLRLQRLNDPPPPRAAPSFLPRPESAASLRAFLPGAIRGRVDAGQDQWLGELRRISVIFVSLSGLDAASPLETAHDAFRRLQIALYRFEGSINKISVDDKGASVVAVLGLPPLAHEDDAERAVRAALNMRNGLAALGVSCAIGVTTGLAFCGVIGNARRREYTVMGDVVNLSARLMVAARKNAAETGGILVDQATWQAAKARLDFEVLAPVMVKGKSEPQPVYRPLRGAGAGEGVAAAAAAPRRSRLIGRDAERALFAARLDRLGAERKSRLLLLEAEAGMGKGRLLQELVGMAQDRGIPALIGSGDPIETVTPYRPFRQMLEIVFPAALMPEAVAAKRTWILDRLPADADLLRDAPLLGDLLRLDWPQDEELRALTGRARAKRLQNLLVRLIAKLAEARPLLLVVKDAQWLDSASLAVLLALTRMGAPFFLVLSARPHGVKPPAEWDDLAATPGLQRLELGPMADDELRQLVAVRLGADGLPDEVGRFVAERAEGNPLLAEELALAMRDAGLIVVEGRACRRIGSDRLEDVPLPHSVEGLITGRIDRLSPDEQLTIKVASVVGRVFSTALLEDIYPIDAQRARVGAHCATLHRLELTPAMRGLSLLSAVAGGEQYKFKSNLTKEVAYNLMLFSQRRELHQRMADWLERYTDAKQPAIVGLLAHHWERAAEDREPLIEPAYKAVGYRAQAARFALAGNAEREAIAGFRQALGLLGRLPEGKERDRTELPLLLELGAALVNATSWSSPEVQALYARAGGLGHAAGDHALLFRARRGEWQYLIGMADYAAATDRAADLLRLAEAADDDALQVEAHRAIGSTRFWTGDFAAARAGLEQALVLFDAETHAELARSLGQDPEVAIRGILAWALALSGEPDAARGHVTAALERAEALKHPFSRVFAHGSAMWLGFFLDDPPFAARHAAAARDQSLERGFAYLATAAAVVHGWAVARLDDGAAGLAEIAETIAAWEKTGGGIGLPLFLLVQGRALLEAGEAAAALARLEDPRLVARVAVERWYAGPRAEWLARAQKEAGAAVSP